MDTVRLGGMALANGVLVHGPTSWACAIRDRDGELRVASGAKTQLAARVRAPILRGPARLGEALAVLPAVKRALPEARFAFERPRVLGAFVASSLVAGAVRRSALPAAWRELVSAFASLAPALMALRGGELASYHGAEHVSIGSYEQGGERAAKEHDRCGSHIVGPLLVTSALAGALVQRAPRSWRPAARVAGAVGALGTSVELFLWMERHPSSRAARLMAVPGNELQSRLSTAEPSDAQLEVADAALRACLEREGSQA